MKKFNSLCLAALLLLGASSSAQAEGFSILDWSARGAALSSGMVGRADDASAVAYNPAGITQLPGIRLMMGTTVVSPMSQVSMTNAQGATISTTKIERKHWVMPHAYATFQLNDSFWAGLGVFSRFGLGNGYPDNWPGSGSLVDVEVQCITLNPNLVWRATDKLSLAAGVEISGATMEMNRHIRRGPLDNHITLDGSGGAIGGNLALRYAFNDAWALGVTYRSRMSINVHGKARWDRQILIPGMADMRNSDLHGTLSLPDGISAGLMWKPTPRLSFEVGTIYTFWSTYRHLDMYLEAPVNTVDTEAGAKHWRDTWQFNASVEYKALDWLTLRAGYGYETSPMNMANADYMVPSNGRQYFSTGVGLNWKAWTLDAAYAYMMVRDLNFDKAAARPGTFVQPGKSHDSRAHIVSLSLGYAF